MLKDVLDFIFLLLKSAVLLAIIGVISGIALVVLLIVMPEQVLNAFEILQGLFKS